MPAAALEDDTNSQEGRAAVEAVRDEADSLPSTTVGGTTAQTTDFVESVYGSFPLMLALISLITFVLLARAFRSIVLPLRRYCSTWPRCSPPGVS